MKISLTVPVLNEEETVQKQITKIINHIEKNIAHRFKVSLIVGDNGSTDNTASLVQDMLLKHDNLEYIYVPQPGVGRVLKKVWVDSESDIVGYMDLDTATDLKHLEEVFKLFSEPDKNVDVVYGTRLHRKSVVKNRSLARSVTSRIFNFILQKYLGVTFSDGMCGFKFLRQKHIGKIIKNGAHNDGWFFCTELLVVSEWSSLRLFELPVHWEDDKNSKVKIFKLAINYLKNMRELKKNVRE